jgi:hypothetical protein
MKILRRSSKIVLADLFPARRQRFVVSAGGGFYLARHLARAGLRAEFRQLPLPGFACKVLICSYDILSRLASRT